MWPEIRNLPLDSLPELNPSSCFVSIDSTLATIFSEEKDSFESQCIGNATGVTTDAHDQDGAALVSQKWERLLLGDNTSIFLRIDFKLAPMYFVLYKPSKLIYHIIAPHPHQIVILQHLFKLTLKARQGRETILSER